MSTKRQDPPEEFEQEIEDLERKLERLRVLFEQYFLGIENLPPLSLQREVVRILHEFSNYHIRKTTHKFRYQAIVQRFNVHRAYWQRTMRAIEEGHHQRDMSRVKRRSMARLGEAIDNAELAKRSLLSAHKGEEAVAQRRLRQRERKSEQPDNESLEPMQSAFLRGVARKRAKRKQREVAQVGPKVYDLSAELTPPSNKAMADLDSPPAPATESASPKPHRETAGPTLRELGISDKRARQIYDSFIEARKQNGQRTDNISYEKLTESMAKQAKKAKDTLGSSMVDFEIVSRKNQVFLKPKPK